MESISSVLPIVCIVAILCFTLAPVQTDLMLCFVVGTLLLILGMGLFSLGADISMTPIGNRIGTSLTRTRNLPLILVGGILSKQTAMQVLEAGIPFVSFSRALICQPDFVLRMKNAEQEESSCLACNGCYRVYRQRPVFCVQHDEPVAQLEKLFFQ